MNNCIDWTEIWDQEFLANKANFLVDKIVEQIHDEQFELHKKLDLNLFEVSLLYRWLLHVGVNTFIERLMRVHAKQKNGIYFNIGNNSKAKILETGHKGIQYTQPLKNIK